MGKVWKCSSEWLTCVPVHACASSSGLAAVVHSRLDGPFHVAERQRPRQLLHPLPDIPGGPVGHGPAGAQLSLPVGDRGPGQRCGGLSHKHTSAMGPYHVLSLWGRRVAVVRAHPSDAHEEKFLLLTFFYKLTLSTRF